MRSRDMVELLREQEQLATLDDEQLATLAGCARLAVCKAGTVLAQEGGPADTFYVVRTGLVAVEAHGPARDVTVDTAASGDLVGWSWIFPPHRWLFDVRCVRECRLIVVDGACIRDKCEADNAFGYRVMTCFSSVVVSRLTSARVRLLDLYGGGTS